MSTKTTSCCSNMDATWLLKRKHLVDDLCKVVYQSSSQHLHWSLLCLTSWLDLSFQDLELQQSLTEQIWIGQIWHPILDREGSHKIFLRRRWTSARLTPEFHTLSSLALICKLFVFLDFYLTNCWTAFLLQTTNLSLVQQLLSSRWVVVQLALRVDRSWLHHHCFLSTTRHLQFLSKV